MSTYRLDVHREGRWWIIDAPDVDYRTQARTLAEVEDMGRDLIAGALDIDPDSVVVEIHVERPADVVARLDAAAEAEAAARKEASRAAHDRREAVAQLRQRYGLSVRDTARLLGVSPGRVYQLLDESHSSGRAAAAS